MILLYNLTITVFTLFQLFLTWNFVTIRDTQGIWGKSHINYEYVRNKERMYSPYNWLSSDIFITIISASSSTKNMMTKSIISIIMSDTKSTKSDPIVKSTYTILPWDSGSISA